MGIGKGRKSLSYEEILNRVSELQILARYLGVTQVPSLISSPLRQDIHPSFWVHSPDGVKVKYKDFATGEFGDLFELLGKMWHMTYHQVLDFIADESFKDVQPAEIVATSKDYEHGPIHAGNVKLEIKVRDWNKDDEEWWLSYGIPKKLLHRANVRPISHYFITKNGFRMTLKADKLAYAFIEKKEGNLTIKVYQPHSKRFKWVSKHDRSVLGLWRMMPPEGERVCICSSVKDALCLTANTGIPAICLQGEAYDISKTAQQVLRERFKNVYILLDNDPPGKADAAKLQQKTGFINIELPPFEGGKDISDLYKVLKNPEEFKTIILNLFQQ